MEGDHAGGHASLPGATGGADAEYVDVPGLRKVQVLRLVLRLQARHQEKPEVTSGVTEKPS